MSVAICHALPVIATGWILIAMVSIVIYREGWSIFDAEWNKCVCSMICFVMYGSSVGILLNCFIFLFFRVIFVCVLFLYERYVCSQLVFILLGV